MAVIAPFQGITYNLNKVKDISRLVAPPYDVISEEQRERYYNADPHNVIRLILGKTETGDTDWHNKYTRAGEYFNRWLSEGILVRAESPSIYLTSVSFDPGDGKGMRTRWGIIALVRIEEDGSGVILPHERTFSAHKGDRLRLMTAANAQFSQIFGIYEDPEFVVSDAVKDVVDFRPYLQCETDDGMVNRMWVIEDQPELFKKVADAFKDKKIFIADGHHRYETARNYRNAMRVRYGHHPDRSYEFVMMYLTNLSDRGLTILPSHRLIREVPSFDLDRFMEDAKEFFEISLFKGWKSRDRDPGQLSFLRDEMERRGREGHVFGLCTRGSDDLYLLTLKPEAEKELGDDLHPALKELDVLILSRLIFQRCLGFTKADLDNEGIFHYQSDMEKALSCVKSREYEMVFFLNPTRIDQVKHVANNSLVMPRKSTYFYPKIITGLVFNKIDPDEVIHVPS